MKVKSKIKSGFGGTPCVLSECPPPPGTHG